MRPLVPFVLALFIFNTVSAQKYTYSIKADSVKLTGCDSNELIIENHTQNVQGFLFNNGNGRTSFKRGAQKLNDTSYLVGADTIKWRENSWLQGGNSFGRTGILGTLDNNHLDLYTNNSFRARLTNTGNLILGSSADAGYKMQMLGTNNVGGIFFQPNLSVPNDRIRIGGAWNTGDGQEAIISLSTDGGGTFSNVLSARGGNIGLGPFTGWLQPGTLRITADGTVGIASPTFYFGNFNGPFNSSALVTGVSNSNEWITGLDVYPNGQNYYYLETLLNGAQAGNKRAPLYMAADQLVFLTGTNAFFNAEAGRFTEAGRFLLGAPSTDDQVHTLQVKGGVLVNGDVYLSDSLKMGKVLTGTSSDSVLVINSATHAVHKVAQTSLAFNGILNSPLAVNGPIAAQKLTLSAKDWPDYVFDSAYQLLPLEKVSCYVREHHHLPGIISATDVEKKGVDVGETQIALLKKIEEMTLYIIKQDKELNELKEQNKRLTLLQSQIDELKALITK
jgi:hypothetical protein